MHGQLTWTPRSDLPASETENHGPGRRRLQPSKLAMGQRSTLQCPWEIKTGTELRTPRCLGFNDRGFLRGDKTWITEIHFRVHEHPARRVHVTLSLSAVQTVSEGIRWRRLSDHSSASPRLVDFGNVTLPLSLSLRSHKVIMSIEYDNPGEELSTMPNTRQTPNQV